MPEGGDTFIQGIEHIHYNKNCSKLIENINRMLNKTKENNVNILQEEFKIEETYGVPYTNFDLCKMYSKFNNNLPKGYNIEVNNFVTKNYNIKIDFTKLNFSIE